jgi:uncharacterized protein (DUF2147 family)
MRVTGTMEAAGARGTSEHGDSNHIHDRFLGVWFSQPIWRRNPMKRFGFLVVLMVLGSPAYASSVSFVVGGHRIRIEAPRYCRSPSCVSLSVPGIYAARHRRDKDDDFDAAPQAASAKPPAPALAPEQASLRPAVPPATKPPIEPVAIVSPPPPPPPAIVRPAAPAPQESAAASPPIIQASKTPPITPPTTTLITSSVTPLIETPKDAVPSAPVAAPQVSKISHETGDEPAQTPLGDWRTEGTKGSVRIERCGGALCGYLLDPSSNAAGEAVLINMKSKAANEWSGNIYSRDSGDTFYGTMAIKGPNALRVEACALGKFFCSGNVWNRIGATPAKLVTYRQISSEPRS